MIGTPSFVPDPSPMEYDFIASCVGANDVCRVVETCKVYGNLLYETNQYLNLTAIPPEQFWTKHICDCLLVLRETRDIFHGRMADVGCGAGLPSVPIAIACPHIDITAIDSRGKKVNFVHQVADACALTNLKTVHARANELAAKFEYINAFNVITARAVSDAFSLMKECRRLLRADGMLCVFRTETQFFEELPDLKKSRASFTSTSPVILPGDAGVRIFLLLSHI